jgi:hypothetical protein
MIPGTVFSHVTPWGWFWALWGSTGAAVEVYWLLTNAANTLSRSWWGVEHIDFAHPLDFSEWTWQHWLMSIVLWVFFGWLSLHLPFGWLRWLPKL